MLGYWNDEPATRQVTVECLAEYACTELVLQSLTCSEGMHTALGTAITTTAPAASPTQPIRSTRLLSVCICGSSIPYLASTVQRKQLCS